MYLVDIHDIDCQCYILVVVMYVIYLVALLLSISLPSFLLGMVHLVLKFLSVVSHILVGWDYSSADTFVLFPVVIPRQDEPLHIGVH